MACKLLNGRKNDTESLERINMHAWAVTAFVNRLSSRACNALCLRCRPTGCKLSQFSVGPSIFFVLNLSIFHIFLICFLLSK